MPNVITRSLSSDHANSKMAPTQQDAADAFTEYLHALEPVLSHAARPVAASGSLDHATGASSSGHYPTPGVLLIGQDLDLGKASDWSGRIGGTALVVWPHHGLQRISYRGAWCLQGGRHYKRDWTSRCEPITALDAVAEWAASELLRATAGAMLNGIEAAGCPEDAREEVIRRARDLRHSVEFERLRPARRRR